MAVKTLKDLHDALDVTGIRNRVIVPSATPDGPTGGFAADTSLDFSGETFDHTFHPKVHAAQAGIDTAGKMETLGTSTHFKGANGATSQGLVDRFEKAAELKKSAEEAKDNEYLRKHYSDLAEKELKAANTDAKKVMQAKANTLTLIDKQQDLLNKEEKTVLEELGKKHKAAVKELNELHRTGKITDVNELKAAQQTLDHNYAQTSTAAKEAFTNKRTAIEEARKGIVEHAAELEKHSEHKLANFAKGSSLTGVVAEAGKRAPMAPGEYEKLGMMGKFSESRKQAWSHSGGVKKAFRVAGVAVGALAVGKGVLDMARTLGVASPKTDDQGKEVTPGIVLPVLELGGGLTLAGVALALGGGKLAKGMIK